METLISQLDRKYEEFCQSLKNIDKIDSEEDIFDDAYEYLLIIENQPKIKELIQIDRKLTNLKREEILKQNSSSTVQRDLIKKLEYNSLSSCYDELIKVVYLPYCKYKDPVKINSEEDIIGDIKIVRNYIREAIYKALLLISRFFSDRNDLRMNVVHQSIIYNFTHQKKHFWYMETVHKLLKPILLKVHTDYLTKSNDKIIIIIDSRRGIYQEGCEQTAYEIGKNSKRLKLIKLLKTKDCRLSDLVNHLHQKEHSIITSISEIKRLFREKANQSYDLILQNDSIGYHLNTDNFEIKIK